ncbi:MAG: CvpA family protein [Candidatus Omnitrophica bacterium]|nr:CvpA family protein [Candidatus Omnitrophota bacterium]
MGYIGFQLGLWMELVKLGSLLAGFFVSFRYYQELGDWLAQRTFLGIEWAAALAMAVLLGAVSFGCILVGKFLERFVQVSFQQKLNKAGGLFVGFLRGVLITSVILVVCQQLPSASLNASIQEHSFSGHLISRVAPVVYDALTPLASRLMGIFRGHTP